MPGTHPFQYFGFGGRQREDLPNIITYFKLSTSEFSKTCHSRSQNKKKFWGGGHSISTSHPLWHFDPPLNLEFALTPLSEVVGLCCVWVLCVQQLISVSENQAAIFI